MKYICKKLTVSFPSMVEDPGSDDLIRWATDGTSFIVARHVDFAKRVLPRFFKHSNFSSFVRQLNMYGFHKVPHLQQGVLQADDESEQWEFSNPHFQRNQPDLLLLVTRKKGRDSDEKEHGNYDLNHILDEISAIKKHQMSISSHLKSVQNDNQILWQENLATREKHQRHQETIDKILRFLASVFSSEKKRVSIPRKRRYLIGDTNTEYSNDDSDNSGNDRSKNMNKNNSNTNTNTNMNTNNSKEDDYEEEERSRAKIRRQSTKNKIKECIAEDSEYDAETLLSSASGHTLPESLSPPVPPSDSPVADLAEAIALNNQTKQQQQRTVQGYLPSQPSQPSPSPSPSPSDIAALLNVQQLQGLQSLFSLAQTNPSLFSQLTNDAFYSAGLPQNVDYSNMSGSGLNTIDHSKLYHHPAQSPSSSSSSPEISQSPASTTSTKIHNITPSNTPHISTSIPDIMPLLQGHMGPNHLGEATHLINRDTDALGNSLDALTQHLGFDPNKFSPKDDALNYVNMDEFLNNYSHPSPEASTSSTFVPNSSNSTQDLNESFKPKNN
ncbi:hypothetical protein J3Q64DRAFT_1295437 [Phycomyces blakesleeanus]|uniref:HSF-type DNA-binding domain-containing protein n=1 Tax=Phycomyces blakesleeanus TaxID=4837 RepID=A0ABR3ALS1_PHYBL